VPMDPHHPTERIAYMLDDSGVAVLLTQARLRDGFPARARLRVLALDAEWARIAEESEAPVESGVTAENLCYVIYTSGSTGRPKGVSMHHRGVVNYIHWGVPAYGADRGNGAPVFTSIAVDLTITNLLPLFAGRPVHLLPEESPVEALAQVLRGRPGFGLIKITPIHLGLLNALLEPGELEAAAHTLVIGADFLSAEPTVFWQDHAPGVRLMNEYGPTETVVGCSAYVLPQEKHRAGPVPVGHAIQNLTFFVLNAHGQPVPVGLPGELYIGGAGVARGYLGRPGLTAEKFVPDPFAAPGARMYRTGDRARWQADGNLLILGRTDNQVKIRGYRVELGEVEAVLRRHEAVSECLVMVREDRLGDRRLVAYVVGDTDAAELRENLLRTLPEYMVPAAFVILDALPETATGKLDRKTLPAPDWGAEADGEAPRDELESRLVRIWAEVLGVASVGPTQRFFELGGNSLLALRLFARVRRELGCDLPVATLFVGGTVRHMADSVRAHGEPAVATDTAPLVPLRTTGTLPPLFVLHPAGRRVAPYATLVKRLGPDQPVYGLQDVGDDLARPVERIAEEHLRAVRTVQPHGPYHLIGWSFGGVVAYEMAVQLERAGERVAFAGVLDTVAPPFARNRKELDDADLVLSLARDVAAQRGRPFTLSIEALTGAELDEQLRRAVEALHAQGAAPAGFDAADLLVHVEVIRARGRGMAAYRPGTYGGPLTLFAAEDHPAEFASWFGLETDEAVRTYGWCQLAPAVRAHRVPGAHVTIGLEPHVETLAARVREELAAARAASAAPAEMVEV
ncbi:MAG TPA: amino acid adenylation domain-containing protein, partial [Longimicrobium sp.]|nr:amino acid adenylation domain-containing protein [Longimicrobium sp.]